MGSGRSPRTTTSPTCGPPTCRSPSTRGNAVSGPELVTPELLRGWPLPDPEGSKSSRGQVVVVGGAATTPGGVALAGLAALRVGAGRLQLALAGSVAAATAAAFPEAGVLPLPETTGGSVDGRSAATLLRDV